MASRVIFIIYSPFPQYGGGRENWLFHIAKELNSMGQETVIISYRDDFPLRYDLSSMENVKLIQASTLRRWRTPFGIVSRLTLRCLNYLDVIVFGKRTQAILEREVRPGDTLIALDPGADALAAEQMKSLKGNKFICLVRGRVFDEWLPSPLCSMKKYNQIQMRTLRNADLVVANGEDTRHYLNEHGVENIALPNGVDFQRFADSSSSNATSFEEPSRDKAVKNIVLLSVATLLPVKGIAYLLEALARIPVKDRSSLRAVFAGAGRQHQYRALSRKLGVESMVEFIGESKNVSGLLKSADLAICLSGGAGTSMAALEAMASGTPIIAWDSPVYRQLLIHKKDALLIPDRDVDELAKGIQWAKENLHEMKTYGRNANEKARQYSWPVISKRFISEVVEAR